MRKLFLYLILLQGALVQQASAQVFNEYYNNANGKKGAELKSALGIIINPHEQQSYNEVWTAINKLDIRSDGKILDRYSNITNFTPGVDQTGSDGYKKEGDNYNREHSFPKGWFNDTEPMFTDIMHLVASDGFVNGKRSDHPFGETNGDSYKSANGYSKLGSCTTEGYSGTVFEPNDEWKGDFARIYFYMVTCYEDDIKGWHSPMLDGKTYPGLSNWALKMLLRWAKNDPVSEVEKKRNDGVFDIQGNRNPFVDFEGLEQFVWGQFTDSVPDLNNYKSIYSLLPDDGGTVTPGGDDPQPGGGVTGTVFSETFDDCKGTGGNDGQWSGSIASTVYKNSSWDIPTNSKVYIADHCIKFGSSKARGSATTPAINVNKDGTYILTFRAGAWKGDATTLKLSVSGGMFEDGTSSTAVTLKNSTFTTYTLKIKATGNTLKITFESGASSNSRFFLDDVVLKSSTTGINRIEQSAEGGPSARRVDHTASMHNRYFDLMGRPVDKTIRGIVIHRGKKVLKR
ncbi:MAG: endonuclease [Prevotella sp.]|nr:endonuclease [Prevotella sp.]